MEYLAVTNAEAIGWLCFIVGTLLLLLGAAIGVVTSLRGANEKIEQAKQKIDDVKSQMRVAATPGLESTAAAGAASASADAAKSALEQVEGIIGSLPVNLRFAGVLVLIGAVLVSVATIQFGGVSLF
jgi:hypothetical protein